MYGAWVDGHVHECTIAIDLQAFAKAHCPSAMQSMCWALRQICCGIASFWTQTAMGDVPCRSFDIVMLELSQAALGKLSQGGTSLQRRGLY